MNATFSYLTCTCAHKARRYTQSEGEGSHQASCGAPGTSVGLMPRLWPNPVDIVRSEGSPRTRPVKSQGYVSSKWWRRDFFDQFNGTRKARLLDSRTLRAAVAQAVGRSSSEAKAEGGRTLVDRGRNWHVDAVQTEAPLGGRATPSVSFASSARVSHRDRRCRIKVGTQPKNATATLITMSPSRCT